MQAIVYSEGDNGSGINTLPLKNILRDYNIHIIDWTHVKTLLKFIFYDGIVPRKMHAIPAELKNHVDGHQIITDKMRLHMHMPDWFVEKYLAPTMLYAPGAIIPPELFPAIIRPNEGYGGIGISVIDTNEELQAAVSKAIEKSRHPPDILISKYQTDILLFHGKKFHCRIYMIVAYIHGRAFYDIWDKSIVITSRLPFHPDARDEEHYDTHMRHTDGDIFTERLREVIDEVEYNTLRHEMNVMCEDALKICMETLKPYEEAPNGYEVLAADILIMSNLRPMLIEINDRVSFAYNSGPEFNLQMSRDVFEWINRVVYSAILA